MIEDCKAKIQVTRYYESEFELREQFELLEDQRRDAIILEDFRSYLRDIVKYGDENSDHYTHAQWAYERLWDHIKKSHA